MFSNSDWWWEFIFPTVLLGVFIGWVLFVGFPWLWRWAKPFLLMVLQ